MRQLYINNGLADIDNKTAIGIDLQAYDVTDPANRKINVSNSFTIPKTNNNLELIGYIGTIQNTGTTLYDKFTCNYWVNNVKFIDSAKLRVQEITKDRIKCFIYQKADIWDNLREYTWIQFIEDYRDYLWSIGLPDPGNPQTGLTWTGFITQWTNNYTTIAQKFGIVVPYTVANDVEAVGEMVLRDLVPGNNGSSGGHTMTYISTIFKFIESHFGVNFNSSVSFDGNIFDDAIFNEMFTSYRMLVPIKGGATTWSWNLDPDLLSTQEVQELEDKTLYDFVSNVFRIFNVLVDEVSPTEFKLRRFDDIEQFADVVDFSGNYTDDIIFKPYLEPYKQNNIIKASKVQEGISELTNARILTSQNKNSDVKGDLFEIEYFIPSFTDNGATITGVIPNIGTKESYSDFKFFIANGEVPENVIIKNINQDTSVDTAGSTNTIRPSLYSLSGEYQLLDSAIDYPKFYEVKRWMRSIDILGLEFFKLYYIRELNGSFFINKIKGFNPDKSRQATTLEVFKISDRTPFEITGDVNNWVDGIGDIWVDGQGNNFTTN